MIIVKFKRKEKKIYLKIFFIIKEKIITYKDIKLYIIYILLFEIFNYTYK